MSANRREFLQLTGAAAGLALLRARTTRAQDWPGPQGIEQAGDKLRILFLGGTRFLGPHQVEYALARGHDVTLFNRGKTNPDLFPQVRKLRGDRDGDLEALVGGRWDAVVDNSAHVPRWVRTACEILKGNVGQYLFVSSTGVYHPYLEIGIDEQGRLGTMENPTIEEVTGDTFGPLKVLCEQEAEKWFPNRNTVIRPHLIVGPGDNSDRFTYWPVRIARGGEVLAPGNPDDPVQLIDVRDLARFCILTLEEGFTGPYNVVGPYSPLSIAELLYGIRATISNEISFTWADREFLEAHEVRAWSHLPVWIPPEGEYLGMCRIDGSLAVAKGLTIRPLAETAQDTLTWWRKLPEDRRNQPRAGLPEDREAEVLAAWHAQG